MKHFIQAHLEWILGISALVLVAALASFYVWGVGSVIGHFNTANSPGTGGGSGVDFQVQEADRLLKQRNIVP